MPRTARPDLLALTGGRPNRPDVKPPVEPEIKYDLVGEFPPPPGDLDVVGAEMWRNLGAQLVRAGQLQVVDLYALEQMCYAWQRFKMDQRAGMKVTASENGALLSFWSKFGLTPADRRRVVSNLEKTPPENRFAAHKNRAS